jgi:hypothetical protein
MDRNLVLLNLNKPLSLDKIATVIRAKILSETGV